MPGLHHFLCRVRAKLRRAALSSIDASDQVTFVDLGCGLGRAFLSSPTITEKRR
jgi:hypothetical protein